MTNAIPPVVAAAPGKVVLAGEYAVLAGAPAMVAAIDRCVTCRVTPARQGDWQFISRGFNERSVHRRAALQTAPGAAPLLARAALAHLQLDARRLPEHLTMEIDSRPCYRNGEKLGIGSSAATAVAVAAALAQLGATACDLSQLLAIHRALQGASGSGLDVAASWHGGVVRYRDERAEAAALPAGVHLAFVHAGWSSETRRLVARFDAWRKGRVPPALRALMDCAEALAAARGPAAFLANLAAFAQGLRALDRAARIGIYSAAHQAGHAAAQRAGVLYKPCGAGGGDMGMAVAEDADALRAWRQSATAAGLHPIRAGISPHGVRVAQRDAETAAGKPTAESASNP